MSFVHLPEAIWVEIMSRLSLADRYRLSRTCHKLYSVFSYPGVWRDCFIILQMPFWRASAFVREESRPLKIAQYLKLAETFGTYIQNLSLLIQGDSFNAEDDQETLLNIIATKCRKIKRLYVDIKPKSINNGNKERSERGLFLIRSLIENSCYSLKVLNLDSWISSENTQQAVPLDCLPKTLEKLSIYHPILTANKWVPMNTITPMFTEVITAVQHMETLKVLSLHCQSVSSELLNELTRSSPYGQPVYPNFTCLAILLVNKPCPFFSISPENWKCFSARTPKILIDISVGNTINPEWLTFLPYVSLQSLKFAQYSRYYPSLFHALNTSELRSFVDFSQGCSELSELFSFISSCSKLQRLVYSGNISVSTVLKLARIKGKKWIEFKVNLDNVIVEYPTPEGIELTEEDVVVRNSMTGDVLQADLFLRPERGFYLTDDHESRRRTELEKMEEEVKKCISCYWEPLRRTKM